MLKTNKSLPPKSLKSNNLITNNNKKLYGQASKINIKDIINIKNMFLTLFLKKVIEVNNIINKSSMVKPKIKMATKRSSRKQVIVLMSQDNANVIGSNLSFHIININRHLKDTNSKILVDFICVDKVSIIIITSTTVSEQDIRTIEKVIKNSEKINKDLVESPQLSQSKSYLKTLGLPYFMKNMNKLIMSQVFKDVLKKTHIFKDIEFSSKL